SLSKSKFLAAASHDLRQPVQSLLLLIEVLKTRLAGSPVKKAVDQMEEAVNALRLLFDSMLDISRLDAGVIVPVLQTVSLDSLLGRLADEYRLRAEHLSLDFRLIPTSVHVRTDPVLIERVLRNLLENALRYCPSGRVLVGCRRKKKMVRIDVVDTGIGIAADHLDDIFEEFHQVANAARDRSQGLGLGLSIVKRIMRLLDGTVSVRSTLGRGSRFSITLPVAHQLVTGDRRAIDGTEGAEGLILIIEDDALLRDSLEMMLRNWGYRTMSACLGEEALAKIEEFGIPDAVIADYRLSSGLTGIETVLRLSETTGQLIPSLIITGDTAPERVREVHGSGLRIMHKPVAADELRRALLGMISIHSRHSVETLTDTKTQ
ncbi:MAG TPA: hybrid sensor histidine kinase/response regulator, partial [Telmatospirillum sp.]|nr:hybrid sensor histidine kinase/response regulator [Telmatospirillum sp.]